MVQKSSSREEVQATIYRLYARLLKAMKVKRIAPSAAQRWEDEALREAVSSEDTIILTLPLPFLACTDGS